MELLLIIILALIVFGPAKLPEIMGQMGKAINDFRRATSDLSEEFNKTIQAELQETKSVVEEAKSVMTEARTAVTDVHSSVNSAVTGVPAPTLVAEPGVATNGTGPNGTTSSEPKPALADTSQWSWETAATPEPSAPADTTVATAESAAVDSETASPVVDSLSPSVETTTPGVETTPSGAETAASDSEVKAPKAKPRDELAPPY